MMEQQPAEKQEQLVFFISYTSQDVAWAEWIAAQLEQADYRCVLQAWDFQPGQNLLSLLAPSFSFIRQTWHYLTATVQSFLERTDHVSASVTH